jgi:hypothetical protein
MSLCTARAGVKPKRERKSRFEVRNIGRTSKGGDADQY